MKKKKTSGSSDTQLSINACLSAISFALITTSSVPMTSDRENKGDKRLSGPFTLPKRAT